MRPAEYMAAGTHDAWRHYGTYGRCALCEAAIIPLLAGLLGSWIRKDCSLSVKTLHRTLS